MVKQLINTLPKTDFNYEIEFKLLVDRYEKKPAIINTHMKGFLNLPVVQKDSHNSLRTCLDTFLKHYKPLERLHSSLQYWNTILLHLIFSKLDISTRSEWENTIKKQPIPSC